MNQNNLDQKDQEILQFRENLFNQRDGFRVGDFIRFPGGVVRRIAYLWDFGQGPEGVQTCDGGSFYLGEGWLSMSGQLYRSVPSSSLRDTQETKLGSCWFFHHNWTRAHNGVEAWIDFRVFECDLPPPD